jgi:hypothetical protein
MNEKIKDLYSELQLKKENLLLDRIYERVKTLDYIDLIEESKRMFPRIKSVLDNSDQSEHWYWNDGSYNGLHLISFYANHDLKSGSDNNKFIIGFTYK